MPIGIADAVKSIGSWLQEQKYQAVGGTCPNCKHYERYRRWVGAPIFGHYQFSCACRLSRQRGLDVSCGCEWTLDTKDIDGGTGSSGSSNSGNNEKKRDGDIKSNRL